MTLTQSLMNVKVYFICTLFKYILLFSMQMYVWSSFLKCFYSKVLKRCGWGLLTLTHNNLIYLGALIGVAPSIVNQKKKHL